MLQKQLNPAVRIPRPVLRRLGKVKQQVSPTVIISVAVALIGIWQFTEQQEQKNKEQFLLKQLEMSFEASDTVAKLATETDPVKWEEARLKFWRLYWGTLSIVEDREVEAAMVHLGSQVPKEPVSQPSLPMKVLERPSLCLAHKARNLLLSSWEIDLAPLKRQVDEDPCREGPKGAS
jgi:hypothetical protein